ncbi:MAG: ABC transporter substrate-binding protein [Planctomycetes bacterium]|nr:ABC transporter substrate-binding protein [Planctomycetota bacterium]
MKRQNPWLVLTVLILVVLTGTQCQSQVPAAPAAVQEPTAAPAPVLEPTAAPAPVQEPTAAPAAAQEPTAAPAVEATEAPAVVASKYNEAPDLKKLVEEGKLPPVEERLPEEPLVMPVVDEIGQYGGVWRRGFLGPSDANNYVRVVYDALARYNIDGSKVEPHLVQSWEPSEDMTAWTVHMRKGAKWSDGAPFTADDILFWYNDCLLNTDLTPALPTWIKNGDGSAALVEKVDTYTVRFTYQGPMTTFPTELAYRDGGDRSLAAFLPAHYLKQYHPNYTPQAEIDKMVSEAGAKSWIELFMIKATPPENPDRPVMAAWMPTTRISDELFILERNPYYVGVDPEGNQLPYLDEVVFKFFADKQVLNLGAIAGELDQQDRHIDMPNYPILKESEQKGQYRVLLWPTFGGSDAMITLNQTHVKDPAIGDLLRTKDFRIALSYAIDREEIKQAAFLGLGEARQPVPAPWHPYYPGDEWARKYTEYRVDEANRLLDGIGLDQKDAEGFRLLPDGNRAIIEISVVAAFGSWPEVAQLVAAQWEAVGVKTLVQVRERSLHAQMGFANELQASIWNNDTTGFPLTGAPQTDPRSNNFSAWGHLYRQWYGTDGKEGMEPPAEVKKLVGLIDEARLSSDPKQTELLKEMFTVWVDNLYQIGTIGLTPMVQGVVVVNSKLRNVPELVANDWPLRTPGNARPQQWFYAD